MNLFVVDKIGESVGAEKKMVFRVCPPANKIKGQVVTNPHRLENYVPELMAACVFRAKDTFIDLILDERMVVSQLFQPTLSEAMCATVSQMADDKSLKIRHANSPAAALSKPSATKQKRRFSSIRNVSSFFLITQYFYLRNIRRNEKLEKEVS